MKVVITEAALSDLAAIHEHIQPHHPQRAASFIEELFERCEDLAQMPQAFPLVPRYESLGIRRRVHGDFLIFYRVRGELIEIIHILRGARDYESLLFKNE